MYFIHNLAACLIIAAILVVNPLFAAVPLTPDKTENYHAIGYITTSSNTATVGKPITLTAVVVVRDSAGTAIEKPILQWRTDTSQLNQQGKKARFIFPKPGTYTITLTVSVPQKDADPIQVATAKQQLEVIANTPPAAHFNYRFIANGELPDLELDASNSYDLDGDILSYTWFIDPTDGLAQNFPEEGIQENPKPRLAFNQARHYQVTLAVEDEQGHSNTTTQDIIIQDLPFSVALAASETASNQSITVPSTITLTPQITNSAADKVNYHWQVITPTQLTLIDKTVTQATPLQIPLYETGRYTVTLTAAIPEEGLTASTTHMLITQAVTQPVALLDAYPLRGTLNEEEEFVLNLDGQLSYAKDSEISCQWLINQQQLTEQGCEAFEYTLNEADFYVVELKVTDEQQNTDKQVEYVQVGARQLPPEPSIRLAHENTYTYATKSCQLQFDGHPSQDRDGSITRYQWQFMRLMSDGATQPVSPINSVDLNTAAVAAAFTEAGEYEAILTVIDNDGQEQKISKNFTIIPIPELKIENTSNLEGIVPLTVELSATPDENVRYAVEAKTGIIKTYDKYFGVFEFNQIGTHEITVTSQLDYPNCEKIQVFKEPVSVKVLPDNEPPIAKISIIDVQERNKTEFEVTVSASGSWDSDGEITAYSFMTNTGERCQQEKCSFTFTNMQMGEITLVVTDNQGMSSNAVEQLALASSEPECGISANVTLSEQEPVKVSPDEYIYVKFEGSASNKDGNNETLLYEWNVIGLDVSLDDKANTNLLVHQGLPEATYIVELTIKNENDSNCLAINRQHKLTIQHSSDSTLDSENSEDRAAPAVFDEAKEQLIIPSIRVASVIYAAELILTQGSLASGELQFYLRKLRILSDPRPKLGDSVYDYEDGIILIPWMQVKDQNLDHQIILQIIDPEAVIYEFKLVDLVPIS